MTKYWVVGANIKGNDWSPEFCDEDYWELQKLKAHSGAQDVRAKMKVGHRIAIVDLDSFQSGKTEILCIGTVTAVMPNRRYPRCDVDWDDCDVQRTINKPLQKAVYGPYKKGEKDWVDEIFDL